MTPEQIRKESEKDSVKEGTCAVCNQPGHRYGTTDKQHKFNAMGCVNRLLPKVAELEAENNRLREVLEKYGRHFLDCESLKDPPECHCGFLEALNKADTK